MLLDLPVQASTAWAHDADDDDATPAPSTGRSAGPSSSRPFQSDRSAASSTLADDDDAPPPAEAEAMPTIAEAPSAAGGAGGAGSASSATHVELLPSPFPDRPPTILFDLPPGLPPRASGMAASLRECVRRVPLATVGRSLSMRIEKNANAVRHAFKRAGFTVNPPSAKQKPIVCWAKHSGDKLWTDLPVGSRVNHFPGSWALGRKDGLARILGDQRQRLGGSEYGFSPRTFTLPQDRRELERAYAQGTLQGGGTLIVKPLNSSRGRGVFITNDLAELEVRDRGHTRRDLEARAAEARAAEALAAEALAAEARKPDPRAPTQTTTQPPLSHDSVRTLALALPT